MWGVFALLALAVLLYTRVRTSIELISFLVLIMLLLLFHVFPLEEGTPSLSQLLGGFANPALITVMALLVVGQGVLRSDALEGFTRLIATIGQNHTKSVIAFILILVFAITAWLNNTPVAVMFIPVLVGLAARTKATPDKIMMPLSFVCILGGMTTLIGSSTNILAVGVAERLGAPHFGFFDITKAGLMLAIPGLLYVLFILPKFLPNRSEPLVDTIEADGRHYIVKIDINEDNPLIGMVVNRTTAVIDDTKHLLNNMRILRTQRGEKSFYPMREEVVLQAGDQVILSANREILTNTIKSRHDVFGLKNVKGTEITLADVVIAPASRIIGRSLSQLTMQYETGCHIIGILRRKRMLRSLIQDIRFEAGDVFLVLGSKKDVRALSHTHDVFLLEWLSTDIPHYTQPIKALAIFLSMVLLAAFEVVPLTIASLMAAIAMILSGVINLRQAIRSLDQRIFFLVATFIGFASALEATQAPSFLAEHTISMLQTSEPIVLFTALFLLIVFITNIISNNAAAILFIPIMLKLSALLELSTELAIITVILAANCSFATPMAYQTNLLVMGPGRYQFKDFIVAGTPLIVLMTLCYIVMAKTLYGL